MTQVRKITKIISVSILATLTILIVALFGFYFWLNHRLNKVIDRKTYNNLVENIRISPDLPEKFYKIYGQVTGYDEKSTTKKFLFYKTVEFLSFENFRKRKNPCPCINANYGIEFNTFDTWTVGFALDRDVSSKKCLDSYLNKFDFLFSVKGIQNASEYYYHKELGQLTDNEMFELSVMTINPSLYNKLRQPEKLKTKVLELKNKMKNN